METNRSDIFQRGDSLFHPGLSVDCVIFGFHNNQLSVLLLKMKASENWALPGGFVKKDEGVDAAAVRVLQDRTNLQQIFLRQFQLFGDPQRSKPAWNRAFLERVGVQADSDHWFLQRFVTLGYYALVDFTKAVPQPDAFSDACSWWPLQELPDLALDHQQIVEKALETLRLQLHYQPIGLQLLPEKFTMPELQKLYETLLGKPLDRRNFQRRIRSYGILKKLNERKIGGAHKAPFLYSFDLDRYRQALQEGLGGGW